MTWNHAPNYDLTPRERAEVVLSNNLIKAIPLAIRNDIGLVVSIRQQKEIINKLRNHGVHSEYEDQVLTELKKL